MYWCVLIIVCCLPSVVFDRCLLRVVCSLLRNAYWLLRVVRWVVFVVCGMLCGCCLLFAVNCLMSVDLSSVVCCLLNVCELCNV